MVPIKNVDPVFMRMYRAAFRRFGDQKWWPARTIFEVIVGTILTQNTSWKNVEKAIGALDRAGLLAVGAMERADEKTLARTIRSCGYYNIKARRLKAFLAYLHGRHGASLRRMFALETWVLRRELLTVNGIGPETADSILLYAGGRPVFMVDAYTRRIFSRHALVSERWDYETVRRVFEANLPRRAALFNDYHAQIVNIGKLFCGKKAPRCAGCPWRAELKPRRRLSPPSGIRGSGRP